MSGVGNRKSSSFVLFAHQQRQKQKIVNLASYKLDYQLTDEPTMSSSFDDDVLIDADAPGGPDY